MTSTQPESKNMITNSESYVGRLNFTNQSWNKYTFSITKSKNPTGYQSIQDKHERLQELYPDAYYPIHLKEYKDSTYYQLEGNLGDQTIKMKRLLQRGELYNIEFKLMQESVSGKIKAVFTRLTKHYEIQPEMTDLVL